MDKYTNIVSFDIGTERPTTEFCEQLEAQVARLRKSLKQQLKKHKHQMHAPVTNDKETWCACFGCELARSTLNA